MNEIIKSLYLRKSVRAYEDKTISDDICAAIVDAAIQAPTAGNQCLYTMLRITSQDIKERLAVLCDNQPFIAKAPLVIIFLADCRRWLDSYVYAGVKDARLPAESDLMLAMADAVIAAQNSVVAAESLGIGSCYIGDIFENEEQVRDLLCLDDYVFPAVMLVYGYPTQQQLERVKPTRYEREFLLMDNTYKRLTENEHREMFERQGSFAGKGKYDEGMTAFYNRKYASDFSLEMVRSVKRYLSKFLG